MARKTYSPEFRRQAVDLYRSTPGATLRGIAADLGISRHTLQMWVHAGPGGDGHHRPAGPERFTERSLERDEHATPACGRERPMPSWRRCRPGSRRWRPRNARLLTEQTKLSTERDILRRAAKNFAGETRW